MKERTLACWACSNDPAPGAFLAGIDRWWPWLDVARHTCSDCGLHEEIQLEDGRVIFGYLYAAAVAHLAGMDEAPMPGLVVRREPGALQLSLGEMTWHVPERARAPGR